MVVYWVKRKTKLWRQIDDLKLARTLPLGGESRLKKKRTETKSFCVGGGQLKNKEQLLMLCTITALFQEKYRDIKRLGNGKVFLSKIVGRSVSTFEFLPFVNFSANQSSSFSSCPSGDLACLCIDWRAFSLSFLSKVSVSSSSMLSECCEKGKTNLAYDYWRTIKTVIKKLKAIPSLCRTYLRVNLFTTLEPYKRLSQKKRALSGKTFRQTRLEKCPFYQFWRSSCTKECILRGHVGASNTCALISTSVNTIPIYKMERFSMKCHKAKPKVITTTDEMKGKYPWEIMRNQSQSSKLSKARDNTGVQFVIGLSFASVWLREWHEFF